MFELGFAGPLISCKSFDKKMKYLKSISMKKYVEDESEFIIEVFEGISNIDQALEFAKFYKERLGNIMVSRKSSLRMKTFRTVIDDVSIVPFLRISYNEKKKKKLLSKAFKSLGFIQATECSFDELFENYIEHPDYREKVSWIMNNNPEKKHKMIGDFFNGLDMSKSISNRLNYLKNSKCSLRILPKPEMIIDRFSDIYDQKTANKVVQTIRDRIKYSSIICREASRSCGEMMTLVDVIESIDYTWKEKSSRQLFINAFKKIGMKRANDTNSQWLKKRYQACADYYQDIELMKFFTNDDREDLYKLYDNLESSTTIDEIIHHLKTSECDFNQMDSPYVLYDTRNCLMEDQDSEYYYEFTIDDMLQIAQIFKDKIGVIAISRMDSFNAGRYMTLLDVVDEENKRYPNDNKLSLFLFALENLGFKRAEECDPIVLRQLQSYSNDYNYDEMKNSNQELKEELMIELYKPERIKRWIDTGCNLEDYLC